VLSILEVFRNRVIVVGNCNLVAIREQIVYRLGMSARTTQARVEITATLRSSGRPITAVEILKDVSKKRSDLNKSTVYRFLKVLVESGEIVCISVPGQASLYELKEVAGHPHFICQDCSQVMCLGDDVVDLKNLRPKGLVIARESLVLSGKCRSCSKP
jgi:Fur family ferric uptake transcriptional regulator